MTDQSVSIVPVPPPTLSRFGPAAIDRAVSRMLEAAVPADADTAIVDVTVKSQDGQKVLTGVVAGNLGDGWGLAFGGAIDLEDRDDYEIGIHVKKAW